METLTNINNLAPLNNLALKAAFEFLVEGDHKVADVYTKSRYPEKLKNNLILKLTYFDDDRNPHITYSEFDGNELINRKA